jgi:hypothetical protein
MKSLTAKSAERVAAGKAAIMEIVKKYDREITHLGVRSR